MDGRNAIDSVLDSIGKTVILFGLVCLVLILILAAYFLVKGVRLLSEAWQADPTNRALRASLIGVLLVCALAALVPGIWPLALLSVIWLVCVARIVQLQHTAMLERHWNRRNFLADVFTHSWW